MQQNQNVLLELVVTQVLTPYPIDYAGIPRTIIQQAVNAIPQRAFGVFVTVRRSAQQKRSTWPEDIHGCIGWWDDDFREVDRVRLFLHLMDVAYGASWEDDRRRYFAPLRLDPSATVEVDFMMLPVYVVDPRSGRLLMFGRTERFNNDQYGLIVDDRLTGHRATYLPHVFPATMPWTQLRNSLLHKASTSAGVFYAYRIVQYTKQLVG